jgi:5-methylcytosine-specific restriction enzyme subunit McrC
MIKIQNIYYMLAYAFQVLNEDSYAKIATEEFEHIGDLFAAILAKGIANQIKRGLGREYICQTNALSSPRGKIGVSASVKQRTPIKKQLVCEFDEFSENAYLNQILKTTALLLIHSEDVAVQRKKALKKVMLYFSEVDTIDHHSIKWSRICYNRNNETYKMLINICYLVIKGLLLTTHDGSRKLATYLDDQSMHRLYEKFVLEYYKKHYPQFSAAPSHIDWNVDDGVVTLLPAMKTDITLQYQGRTLIIDTKYYEHTLQTNYLFNSQTIHSNNMYQIFTYVKNKDVQNTGKVSGVLLYAKTDEALTPDNDYVIGGNKISVKTLDLNTDFTAIKRQLSALVDQWSF